jgi:hypothetical protein
MKEIEKEAMAMFKELTPMNQSLVAIEMKRTYLIEQAVKRQYGLDQEQPAQRQREGAA